MFDINNDLSDLGRRIEEALESVVEARKLALHLIGDDPPNHDPGWPAMTALYDKLGEAERLLHDLPGDEIAKAIKAADSYLDHLSDLADGASY